MAILDKITANMELTDLKKFRLQKAILALMLEFKHLDEYMDSTHQSFQECFTQLEQKEQHLNSVGESAIASNMELESVRLSIEERVKELDDKERVFRVFQKKQIREFKLKEKQLDLIGKSVEERVKEVELREERVKLVEGLLEEFKFEERRFEDIRKSIGERIEEVNLKEMELEKHSKELDCVRVWIDGRVKELDDREEQLEGKEKELGDQVREIEAMREEFNNAVRTEKHDDIAVEGRIKGLDDRKEQSEAKEKHLGDQVREIKVKMGEVNNAVVSTEVITEKHQDIVIDGETDLQFFVKMDGKGLQAYLNRREKDHDSMGGEVYFGLLSLHYPAKLVLDAMEGFYQTRSDKGKGEEFELNIVRRSCILLLQQLLRISPQVGPDVEKEATKLFWKWKGKMRAGNNLQVLGILYLLAAYRLPVPFDDTVILRLFESVAEHRQSPELCRVLGFTEKVPDLICNLIKGQRNLMAVRFICEFGLDDKFPPAPLLKSHVKQVKKISIKNMSRKAQNAAIDKRVAAMQEVIRCIIDHKLGSTYSPSGIMQSINFLLKKKAGNNGTAPPSPSKDLGQEKTKKESISSISSSILCKPLSTAPSSSISVSSKCRPVIDIAFILTNMDGRNLQIFLNELIEDHELMRDEVLLALQQSFDPARLVLDAMQGFYPPHRKEREEHFEASVIRSSCILLLEQLMKVRTHILPQVKGVAMVIAHNWKMKMRDEIENPQVILGFLQLISAFGVTTRFDRDELLCLFENIAQHQHARELCRLLGVSEKNPGCIIHRHLISEGSSSENVALNDEVAVLNLSHPAPKSKVLGVNVEERIAVPIFQHVSDPAKLVMVAIRGCYRSNMEKGDYHSRSTIIKKYSFLLKQLIKVSPKIKSQVQEEAMAFSVEWKEKLQVLRNNRAEVTAFLYFLATYKLGSSVMFEELQGLLDTAQHSVNLELCRLLDFKHNVPDYIQHLIENDERLLAISFICEFDLAEKFPPVPILKSHLRYIASLSTKICEEGDYSPEAMDTAADKEVGGLYAVIRCLSLNKIECEYTPKTLHKLIDQLKKQKQDRKILVPSAASRPQRQLLDTKKRAADFEVEPQQKDAIKRPRVKTPTTADKPQEQDVLRCGKVASPVAAAGNPAPLQVLYPVNPLQAPPQAGCPLNGQGRPYLAWQYAYGGLTPGMTHPGHLGWQYRPDAGAYYVNMPSAFNVNHSGVVANVNPRPSLPQATPYLYRPWPQ